MLRDVCVVDNGVLLLADCRDILPTLNGIYAIVTDPPYGMKYKSGPNSRNSISSVGKRFTRTIHGDDVPFDPTKLTHLPCAFTGAQWFYDRLPLGGSLHCWDKRGNYKPLDQADADMIWISVRRPSRVFHLAWRGICRHSENRERIYHPTQKPVAIMKWMMDLLNLPRGVTVLDPYMGVGTTGIACLQTGRRFIGIEIEPEYFHIACDRLKLIKPHHDVTRAA